MTQFNGYVCDVCGRVVSATARTKKTMKYDGPSPACGEIAIDLCSECAVQEVEGLDLRPLRRRRTGTHQTSPTQEAAPSTS